MIYALIFSVDLSAVITHAGLFVMVVLTSVGHVLHCFEGRIECYFIGHMLGCMNFFTFM